MQTHQLKRRHKNKKSRLVGRGGTRGKTSGRGTKGQKARSGRKLRPEMRDIIKKLPKLRGRGKNSNKSIEQKPVVINLEIIERHFEAGTAVTPITLVGKNILSPYKGRIPQVKILGNGNLTKNLDFSDCLVSTSARSKIEKAGGKVNG